MAWDNDGRATFSYGDERMLGDPHVIWRRIGTALRSVGLQVECSVDLATMADRCDCDYAGVVVHGIDHPVVARANAQIGPVAGKRLHAGWAGVAG